MDEISKAKIVAPIAALRLPRYEQIPDVGLYLEQTVKYISSYLNPVQDNCITGSMVSNYVKMGLLRNPVKKQYGRDQIAYLFFIALAKNVLSLENLAKFIRLQQNTYPLPLAYDYFCMEFENILQFVIELKEQPDAIGTETSDEKFMLRKTIIAIAHKIYLEKCFSLISAEEAHTQD